MYQNFVSDNIQSPFLASNNWKLTLHGLAGHGYMLSAHAPVGAVGDQAFLFEIDPSKNTLLSIKAALTNASLDTLVYLGLFHTTTPLTGEGDITVPAVVYSHVVPVSIVGQTDSTANFTFEDRFLLPKQVNSPEAEGYYYAVISFSKHGGGNSFISLNGRCHYKDLAVYQPSK